MGGYRKPERDRETRRLYRAKLRETNDPTFREERRRYKRSLTAKRMIGHDFIGVDGEGWTDDSGVHHYMTLTVGDRTLYTGEPLTTLECLDFLADLPVEKNLYHVSFFFDYDVTMILRDMAREEPELARSLFLPRRPGTLVWYRGFGLDYRPKKHLSVKRWTEDPGGSRVVTIHDVQGFYQSSFVDALDSFKVGTPEERDRIRDMKLKRSSFSAEDAPEIIAYSEEECRLLCLLVGKLRDASHLAGLNASPYEGPGDMARRALERHYGRDRHKATLEAIPHAVQSMAEKSYYGGRFEILAHGPIQGEVYEYDLKSAYPAAMRDLPCLIHGRWVRGVVSDLCLANVEWDIRPDGFGTAMPLPVRRRNGTIFYPSSGEGWYWRHEWEPFSQSLGIGPSWSFIPDGCECNPFGWVHEIFTRRAEMEREAKGSGIALKLTLNTLYGKMVQTRPQLGSFFNVVYASLITSLTRTKVYEVYRQNPGRVIMFATDAVFTLGPVEGLDLGSDLGQWEEAHSFSDMTIFQPGVYFDGSQAAFKTRGVPKKVFRDHAELLKGISLDFSARMPVTLDSHLSLRLALSRGTPEALNALGNWTPITKSMTSNPQNKRDTRLRRDEAGNHWSRPIPNGGRTVPYSVGLSQTLEADFRLSDDYLSDGFYEGDF